MAAFVKVRSRPHTREKALCGCEKMNLPNNETCWICGAPATTHEHKVKRSDLHSEFGDVTLDKPLFYYTDRQKKRVASLSNDRLTFRTLICQRCNTSRTQPYDFAWKKLSEFLRTRIPKIEPGALVRANRIFPHDTAGRMLDVHLYFVKLFGCHIVESKIPLEIDAFASAILNKRPHPHVYIKFGCNPSPHVSGTTDVHCALLPDGSCTFATWFYEIGNLSVNVMFALAKEKRAGLKGAWHPRLGTNRIEIANFNPPNV